MRPETHRGVSLVEIMISIGVIGALIGIALPALMSSRAAAGRVASLANARSAAQAIDAHRAATSDTYPTVLPDIAYPTDPSGTSRIVNSDNAAARWNSRTLWWAVIASTTPSDELWQWLFSPGLDPDGLFQVSYEYSNSFVAAPRLWRDDFDGSIDVLRPVRGSEVAHPSNKALVWDAALAYEPRNLVQSLGRARLSTPIAFADQHAATHRIVDAAPAVRNALNTKDWAAARLHNTPDGVQGRDF